MSNEPYKAIFEPESSKEYLKSKTVNGVFYSILASVVQVLVTIVALAFLSRILSRSDYGIIAMVAPVVAFMALFADLGLGTPVVQRKNLTHQQASTLFWVGLLFGTTLFLACLWLQSFVADFYHEPRAAGVFAALSFGIVLSALQAQHSALLTRNMRFRELAMTRISSALLGALAGITAAFAGAGYWSLVVLSLTNFAVRILSKWYFMPWRPGSPRWDKEIGAMVGFGANVSLFGFLSFLSQDSDKIILGRFTGAMELGLYALAFRLLSMPIITILGAIGGVMLPAMSRLQDQPERQEKYYVNMIGILALLMGPPIITIAVMSHSTLVLIAGPKWGEAAPILSALSITAFIQIFYVSIRWIHLARGNSRQNLFWALFTTPVYIGAFLIGVKWGAIGVAVAHSLSNLLLIVPAYMYALRGGGIRGKEVLKNAAYPALTCSGLTFIAVNAYAFYFDQFSPLVDVITAGMICLLVMGLFCVVYFGIDQIKSQYRTTLAGYLKPAQGK